MVKITKNYEDGSPSESELKAKLASEGLAAETWSADAGTVKDPETAAHNRTICVVSGMVRFTLPGTPQEYADLMSGDRLDITSGTPHGMMVGPAGVTVVEGK
ncbi:MAG: hypothetical protein OEY93_05270 [Anaerolineae bacterium]|nr:hypothetical protein [Anaerolineae bacterium]